MKTRRLCVLAICVGVLFSFASWSDSSYARSPSEPECCADRWDPARSERQRWGQGKMGPGQHQRMQRHWTFMHQGVPKEYQAAINPLLATSANLQMGARLYQQNCAQCHGQEGMGDGEVAKTLNPSPALLAYLVHRPMAVDKYLLWSVAEGGSSFGTDMPAFKDTIERDDIWRIILYLRAGLPQLVQSIKPLPQPGTD